MFDVEFKSHTYWRFRSLQYVNYANDEHRHHWNVHHPVSLLSGSITWGQTSVEFLFETAGEEVQVSQWQLVNDACRQDTSLLEQFFLTCVEPLQAVYLQESLEAALGAAATELTVDFYEFRCLESTMAQPLRKTKLRRFMRQRIDGVARQLNTACTEILHHQ